jgi:dihydroceramide fatty acyl 2-hydroxylase
VVVAVERVSRSEVLRASPALFESRWLDRLTRVRPFVPALVFGPVIGLLAGLTFAQASLAGGLAGLVGGYGLWTLAEYWIHRSLFHIEPRSRTGERVHFIIHGVHHDHPNDPLRLVMPPVVSIPVAVVFFAVAYASAGAPLAYSLSAGFYGGYLAYDLLHYSLHHTRPRSRLGRRLHELHMRHHFEDDTRGFGVSAPWWDTIFRTASSRTKKPTPT